MATERSSINPWVRAELELYSPETEILIPEGDKEAYRIILQELSHARAIANDALGRVYMWEEARREFFDQIRHIPRDNVIEVNFKNES